MINKLFVIYGLRRSGNHAIINWLAGMSSDNCVYYSNRTQMKRVGYNRIIKESKTTELKNREQPTGNHDLYILSNEDISLSRNSKIIQRFAKNHDVEPTRIILLRSPHNNLASLLSDKTGKINNNITKFKELWPQYSKEALNKSLTILYDMWFESIDYRKQIASKLGLEHNDKYLNLVTSIGSSFDGHNFNGKAQKMDVTKRWVKYKNNKLFWDILLNDDFIIPTQKLFGIDISKIYHG